MKVLQPKYMLCLAASLIGLIGSQRMALVQESKSSAPESTVRFNFEQDVIGQPPQGFTSYASGNGPAGKWLVQEMADAPSAKRVVVQTDAGRQRHRLR